MSEREDQIDDMFAQGVILFNDGEFFEAHEIWEDAWNLSTGADRPFLQGLIILAVARLKAEKGNANGTARLLKRTLQYFGRCPDLYRGMDVAGLCLRIQPDLEAAEAWRLGLGEPVTLDLKLTTS